MFPARPQRLSLAQLPTPLQLLERISSRLNGPRIWLKRDDLTGSVLTGNKIRKLEYLAAEALEQGADVLITSGGVQSNHCRATALVAAQLGLRAHLILRGEEPDVADANLLLDRLCGATTAIYTAAEYQSRLPALFQHWHAQFREQGLKPYLIPTGGSNHMGLWGYIDAACEMHEQFANLDINPQYVVCATGSGGTQAGLSLGFSRLRPEVAVLGMAVCDSETYFGRKVRQDIASWSRHFRDDRAFDSDAIHTCDSYIGPGYAQAEQAVFDTISWLARTEGVVFDPVYTGKAFHGLVEEIRRGRFSGVDDIVFVHTGGVFGLFPYRNHFAPNRYDGADS